MTVSLMDAREKLAAALAPVADSDPTVLVGLVDALEPPALMIGWGDPWLEPDTSCLSNGRLTITAVAGRLVPGEGVSKLEELVGYVLGRLKADPQPWPLVNVTVPRVFVIARTNYIATRITVSVKIN